MTIVKVEVGRSALHWEHWICIEHFLCARYHPSPGHRVNGGRQRPVPTRLMLEEI